MRFCILLGIALSLLSGNAHAEISAALKAELVRAGASPRSIDILNQRILSEHYRGQRVGIVDYTLSSIRRRFFVIDLRNQSFDAYHVSHGVNSGGVFATRFSNIPNSQQSSLGFIRTDIQRSGAFGRSIVLIGLSPSNSNLSRRSIILHSAEYSSDVYQMSHGAWGRSFGCLAVNQKSLDQILSKMGKGTLILAYHDLLWDEAQRHPEKQELETTEFLPEPTEWEKRENKLGDPMPFKKEGLPTWHYKVQFGADFRVPCHPLGLGFELPRELGGVWPVLRHFLPKTGS